MLFAILPSRDWMYKRLTPNKGIIPEFEEGVLGFLEYISGRGEYKRNSNTITTRPFDYRN